MTRRSPWSRSVRRAIPVETLRSRRRRRRRVGRGGVRLTLFIALDDGEARERGAVRRDAVGALSVHGLVRGPRVLLALARASASRRLSPRRGGARRGLGIRLDSSSRTRSLLGGRVSALRSSSAAASTRRGVLPCVLWTAEARRHQRPQNEGRHGVRSSSAAASPTVSRTLEPLSGERAAGRRRSALGVLELERAALRLGADRAPPARRPWPGPGAAPWRSPSARIRRPPHWTCARSGRARARLRGDAGRVLPRRGLSLCWVVAFFSSSPALMALTSGEACGASPNAAMPVWVSSMPTA